MLRSLFIQNVALIERAEIEFGEGFNVLSGETGAGKSVILDCIDFVLGAKADKGMVRRGEKECLVRAVFSSDSEAVGAALSELDIEAEEEIVISRKLTSDGRGSLKLNGCTVTAAMLRKVTSLLVDVHGQSEHFFLLRESNQLRLLDSVAGEGVEREKAALPPLLAKRKELSSALSLLGGNEGERSRRMDILRYQIGEIERGALREGEEEELLSYRERCRNAERILQGLNTALECLRADGGCVDALNTATRSLNGISKFAETYSALSERIENACAEIEDVADCIEEEAGKLDVDEREAERVEMRLDEIKSLKKKYGGSVEKVLLFLEDAQKEYELLGDSGERYEKLTAELETVETQIYARCISLAEERRKAAEVFTRRVTEELKTLAISSARFEIEFGGFAREDVKNATSEGLGGVRFLFSANAGEELKPLGKIISGGEMSRFMLAVKAQLSRPGGIGTYLFDEIDAGIGGRTARVVAEKLFSISKNVQIIAVSHLAQVASFADREFLIEKREDDGRTLTHIHPLHHEERLHEIARLIGGDTGEAALTHARELLEIASAYKNSHA